MLRGRRYRRLTQHLLPGGSLGLTRAGLSPAGLHQLWLAPSEIEAKENTIRISGKKTIAYGEQASVHRRERVAGVFDRTLSVPIRIEPDGVKAEYRDGVLALLIPRAEADKPRTIKIS